jgi:hypothetical protein
MTGFVQSVRVFCAQDSPYRRLFAPLRTQRPDAKQTFRATKEG